MASNNRNNRGSGFTNYDTLLNANQGAGERLGQAIGSGIDSQRQSVENDLNNQNQDFQQGYGNAQNSWSTAQSQAQALANNAQNATNTNDWSTVTGQTDANGQPLNYNAVGNNFRNFNYTGPQGLSNVSSLQSGSQSLDALNQLAGNSSGQQQLLSSYVGGRNGYNQGESQFDQALLNKYGQGSINQSRQGLSGVSSKVQNTINTDQNLAGQAQVQIQNGKNDVQQKIQNSLSNAGSTGLMDMATQQGKDYNGNVQAISDLLSGLTTRVGNQDSINQLIADINTKKDGNTLSVQDLIGHLGDYGFKNTDPNSNDPNGLASGYYKQGSDYNKGVLASLLGTYANMGSNVTQGGKYFQGDQQKAAQNLYGFLGDNLNSNAIANNQFNNNVFSQNSGNYDSLKDINSKMANEKTTDQNFANAYATYMGLNGANGVGSKYSAGLGGGLAEWDAAHANRQSDGNWFQNFIAGDSHDAQKANNNRIDDRFGQLVTNMGWDMGTSGINNYFDPSNPIIGENYSDAYKNLYDKPLVNYIAPGTGYADLLGGLGAYNRNAPSAATAMAALQLNGGVNAPFSSTAGQVGTNYKFNNLLATLTGYPTTGLTQDQIDQFQHSIHGPQIRG